MCSASHVQRGVDMPTKHSELNQPHVLVVADVDGTVVPLESSWWMVHSLFGTQRQAAVNFRHFSKGEWTYEEWAQGDAALWAGHPVEPLLLAARSIEPRPEFGRFAQYVRAKGAVIVFVSSGIDLFIREMAKRFRVETWFANHLTARHGLLTGRVEVNVPLDDKGRVLDHLRGGASTVIGVGDSVWDRSIFDRSDLYVRLEGGRYSRRPRGVTVRNFDFDRVIAFLDDVVRWSDAAEFD